MKKLNGLLATGFMATALFVGVNVDGVSANTKFKDVSSSDIFSKEVDYLTSKNIINGYSDGTFKPNDKVTRSQSSKIIIGAVDELNIVFPTNKQRKMVDFKDVRNTDWHKPYITEMYVNKIISGYEDGTFKPNNSVTNSQVAKMISETFGMTNEKSAIPYTDIPKGSWYTPYVSNLYATGVVTRGFDSKFNPSKVVTRAELSVMISKAMDWKESKLSNKGPVSNGSVADAGLPNIPGSSHKYAKSYAMIQKGLTNVDATIHFDTAEMDYKQVGDLIEEIMEVDANRYYIKNWVSYGSGKIEMKYNRTKADIQNRDAKVDKKADEILKNIIKPTYTDYDKVKAVHDYLVLNTAYDYENFQKGTTPDDSYTAYGALMLGVAVCDGYTRATTLLLNKLGIESIYTLGYVQGDGLHSWNMVKLDGEYFHMDVTWDDPVPNKAGYVGYNYFLINSKQLAKDHTWKQADYPVANSTKYSKR